MNLDPIINSMPEEETLTKLVGLFKVLGDSTRAKILYTLQEKELCVNDICYCVKMNKSAVSHQLRILRDAHLVKARKDGKEVYYSFDDEHVDAIFNSALDHVNE